MIDIDFGKSGQGGGTVFLPLPLPPSFDHRLGRNFYLSPTFLCSDNPIREEVLSVRLPKIRLHCRLHPDPQLTWLTLEIIA